MNDFLLELRSEEIPARMQAKAKDDLARLFTQELALVGLNWESTETFATPRRLALIARGLPDEMEGYFEELKGPRVSAPPQALEGFLRKNNLTRDQLSEHDGVYFAAMNKPGRATADVLAEAIPAIVRAFPWPKSMRWGSASLSTESLRWVRPLQGVVALFGETVVPFEIDGIASGATTLGHRFHHPGPITIGSAHDYVEKLRACHVIVHFSERCAIIRDGANALAAAAGCTLVEDEGLVAENAGLTEWPVPLSGSFDPAFLAVPPEVIALTARTNQKYFVMRDGAGALAPRFVCVANIVAPDGGAAIVTGNERVLAARLSDAKFFWETDLKVSLEDQAKKLDRIVFHEKLGTVADKVERLAKLARWLCEEGIVKGDADLAERAARLSKADLVTGMVGEFPELQGIIGGHLARAQGEPDAVADAIRDHYKPVGQGDDVPTAPVTVAVSLADKLDTLLSFFDIKQYPTGSKDPFALRRAALGILKLIQSNRLVMQTDYPIEFWLGQSQTSAILSDEDIERRSLLTVVQAFLADRLAVQQREEGIRHDFVEASGEWHGRGDTRLDRIVARAKALQAFVGTDEGANLLAGYKRAANILKKDAPSPSPSRGEGEGAGLSYTPEACESALIAALDSAEPRAAAAIDAEDFEGAMTALATLRAPIDAFFEGVMVNDPDADKRAARLALLARFRDVVHRIADFSRIEG